MSLSDVFSYTALVHAISGTAGGSTAMTIFYPLDNIRTFLQVDSSKKSSIEVISNLVKEEGLGVLYRGLAPVLISLGFSNFVYFYSNNSLKILFKKLSGQKNISIVLNLLVASIAGCINVFTTCPLWVANTRLKVQKGKSKDNRYDGLLDAMIKIGKEEGIAALWNGCYASLALVSNPTIQFVVYDKIRAISMIRANKQGRTYLSSWEIFVIGAIAKAVATVLTYPVQLAQSILRATKGHRKDAQPKHISTDKKDKIETKSETPEYSGTIDCLIKIFKRDGFFGWFRGLFVKLVQTVLTAAFQFMAYEKIARTIFTIFKLDASSIKHSE